MFGLTTEDDEYNFDIEQYGLANNQKRDVTLKSNPKMNARSTTSGGSEDALEKAKRMLSKYSSDPPSKSSAIHKSKLYDEDDLSFDEEDSMAHSSSKELVSTKESPFLGNFNKSMDFFDDDFIEDYTSDLSKNMKPSPPLKIQRESEDSEEIIDPQYLTSHGSARPKVLAFEGGWTYHRSTLNSFLDFDEYSGWAEDPAHSPINDSGDDELIPADTDDVTEERPLSSPEEPIHFDPDSAVPYEDSFEVEDSTAEGTPPRRRALSAESIEEYSEEFDTPELPVSKTDHERIPQDNDKTEDVARIISEQKYSEELMEYIEGKPNHSRENVVSEGRANDLTVEKSTAVGHLYRDEKPQSSRERRGPAEEFASTVNVTDETPPHPPHFSSERTPGIPVHVPLSQPPTPEYEFDPASSTKKAETRSVDHLNPSHISWPQQSRRSSNQQASSQASFAQPPLPHSNPSHTLWSQQDVHNSNPQASSQAGFAQPPLPHSTPSYNSWSQQDVHGSNHQASSQAGFSQPPSQPAFSQSASFYPHPAYLGHLQGPWPPQAQWPPSGTEQSPWSNQGPLFPQTGHTLPPWSSQVPIPPSWPYLGLIPQNCYQHLSVPAPIYQPTWSLPDSSFPHFFGPSNSAPQPATSFGEGQAYAVPPYSIQHAGIRTSTGTPSPQANRDSISKQEHLAVIKDLLEELKKTKDEAAAATRALAEALRTKRGCSDETKISDNSERAAFNNDPLRLRVDVGVSTESFMEAPAGNPCNKSGNSEKDQANHSSMLSPAR